MNEISPQEVFLLQMEIGNFEEAAAELKAMASKNLETAVDALKKYINITNHEDRPTKLRKIITVLREMINLESNDTTIGNLLKGFHTKFTTDGITKQEYFLILENLQQGH